MVVSNSMSKWTGPAVGWKTTPAFTKRIEGGIEAPESGPWPPRLLCRRYADEKSMLTPSPIHGAIGGLAGGGEGAGVDGGVGGKWPARQKSVESCS